MSDADQKPEKPGSGEEDDASEGPSQGPNLALLYSLIALAFAAAIGFALMIVMPFHHQR